MVHSVISFQYIINTQKMPKPSFSSCTKNFHRWTQLISQALQTTTKINKDTRRTGKPSAPNLINSCSWIANSKTPKYSSTSSVYAPKLHTGTNRTLKMRHLAHKGIGTHEAECINAPTSSEVQWKDQPQQDNKAKLNLNSESGSAGKFLSPIPTCSYTIIWTYFAIPIQDLKTDQNSPTFLTCSCPKIQYSLQNAKYVHKLTTPASSTAYSSKHFALLGKLRTHPKTIYTPEATSPTIFLAHPNNQYPLRCRDRMIAKTQGKIPHTHPRTQSTASQSHDRFLNLTATLHKPKNRDTHKNQNYQITEIDPARQPCRV